MQLRPFPACLLATFACASAAPLHAQTDPPYPGTGHWLEMHELTSGRRYGEGVALRLSEDVWIDYVALVGDEAVMWQDIANHGARVPLGVYGNDIAVQRDFPGGLSRAIVIPDEDGLQRYWYSDGVLQNDTIADGNWEDARFVDAGFFQAPYWDFVGVKQVDTDTFALILNRSSQGFEDTTEFEVDDEVLEVEVLDVDARIPGGLQEIAFRHADGFSVYEPDGTPRCSVTGLVKTIAMTSFYDPVLDGFHVAIVTEDQGVQDLHLYEGDGTPIQSWSLGSHTIGRISRVDFDNQGDLDELVASPTSQLTPLLFSFTSLVAPYTVESLTINSTGIGIGSNEQAPIVTFDLDDDKDQDLVYACSDTDDLYVFKNHAIDARRRAPTWSHGTVLNDDTVSLTWDMPQLSVLGAQIIHVEIWNKRATISEIDEVEIETPTHYVPVHTEPINGQQSFTVTVPLGQDAQDWSEGGLALYAVTRLARQDATGKITFSGPASIHVVAGRMATLVELQNAPYAPDVPPIPWSDGDPAGEGYFADRVVNPHPESEPPVH